MSEKNIETFKTMLSFWNKHDSGRAVEFLTEDVDYWDITMQWVKGREEVRKIFQSFFDAFPDLSFELTGVFASGDRLAGEWRMRGTQAAELQGINAIGKSIDIVEASLCTFRNGAICRQIDYWDSGTLLRQLGIAAQ